MRWIDNYSNFIILPFFFSFKDVGVFMDEWARQGGHARFQMEFFYNRKRNTVEMKINQDAAHQGARGVRKYVGPVTVGKKNALKNRDQFTLQF